jgi:hypothetical protein
MVAHSEKPESGTTSKKYRMNQCLYTNTSFTTILKKTIALTIHAPRTSDEIKNLGVSVTLYAASGRFSFAHTSDESDRR